jgi:LacI family transcriptional regulator
VVDLATYADHFSAPRVFGRDEERGRLAAEHLVSLGLRDFGFVTFHDNPYQTHRMEGFRLGIERAGGRFQVITRSEFARRLPSLPRPMGLATMGDIFSVELIQLCLSHGVQVPEEFAIIGIDDTEVLCDFAPVALSSVNCDHFGIGYQAAALLDRLMRGEAPPSRPVLVPARGVTVRASTDMLAIPDLTTRKILRFLRTNHSRPIRLKDLPPDLLPGLRNAQRHFKAYTGRSFVEELTRLRLEHARRLLVSTRDKIATLARAAGFTQTAYFCRVFKKSTGMSPKAYQRSRRQENAVRAGPA